MPSKNTTSPGIVTPTTATAIQAATTQLRELLDTSSQAIYVYLDDHNKVCNKRFAQLLGYPSADAWAAVHTSFPSTFVTPGSQEVLIETYQAAMNEGTAATIPVTWKRKDGKPVETEVILVPIEVNGTRLALHFISG
jgi:PAS domain S-box-containing protein